MKPKLFNPNGNDFSSKLLWDNETIKSKTGIANLNFARHSYVQDTWWKRVYEHLWNPVEISMIEDKKQFGDLDKDIKDMFEKIISFLILLDSIVPENTSNLFTLFADKEIKFGFYAHMYVESLHQLSYQYILKSLYGEDDNKINEVYYKFKYYEPLLKRNNQIVKNFEDLNEVIYDKIEFDKKLERLIFRSMLQDIAIEGIVFFMGFTFFHYLAYKKGILVNTNQQIMQIRYDEQLHIPLFVYLVNKWKEQGYYWNDEEATEIIVNSALADIEFYTEAIGDRISVFNSKNIEDYIKTLTNRRLNLIGLKPVFDVNRNPFEDIEKMLFSDKASFFETGNVDYIQLPISIEQINKIFE